ncbi:MAG: bifunctional adenosylcobinamide kinase/adenosylcobinamide-phosphate guanylyltransferase [Clostridia bacterium]
MIFITGGKSQGKTEFAKSFKLNLTDNLEDLIKNWLEENKNIEEKINELFIDEKSVIVCLEVGCGIVPLDKQERIYREVVGRTACLVAKKADEVYRLNCGIAQKIK